METPTDERQTTRKVFDTELQTVGLRELRQVGSRREEPNPKPGSDWQKEFWEAKRQSLVNRIPKRFRGGLGSLRASVPNLAQFTESARLWCEKFTAKTERGLYFYGGIGSGKSALAYAIAVDLLDRGWNVLTWYAPDLYAAIKASYDNHDAQDEMAIVEECDGADLLVLDDVGAEKGSDWTAEVLLRIVDHRYRDCRPLIVTSNVSAAEACRSAGLTSRRIASRLCEMTDSVCCLAADQRITERRS